MIYAVNDFEKPLEVEMRPSISEGTQFRRSFDSNLPNLGRLCISMGLVYSAYLSMLGMITGIFDEVGY